MSRSKIKLIMGVFLDWKAIEVMRFVARGEMVNKQLYQELLAVLRVAVCRKGPELWENEISILHHDNAPAHALLVIRRYQAKHHTSVVPHHPTLRT